MSRAGVSRALVALVTVSLLASCTKETEEGDRALIEEVVPSVDSVLIKFTCDTVLSIALTTPSGGPAWSVRRQRNNPISWVVPGNVTINSIVGKTSADTLPLDPDGPQGGTVGAPFKSKVKANAQEKAYNYSIDASCTASGNTTRLLIDPEFIVRPH
jgi:hypothetical protein